MLLYPETGMRGQPDLLFWRVYPRTTGGTTAGRGVDEVEGTSTIRDGGKGTSGDGGKGGNGRGIDGVGGKGTTGEGDDYLCSHSVFAVEVKSKNDKLSSFQCLWLELLKNNNIAVETLRILEDDV
jgi:hypothetical protein